MTSVEFSAEKYNVETLPESYDELIRDVSFYRDVVPENQVTKFISERLNEEVDELLRPETKEDRSVKMKILWGLEVEDENRKKMVIENLISELGDCVFYIAAGCHINNLSFSDAIDEAAVRFTGREEARGCKTLRRFDEIMDHRIKPQVKEGYDPNYLTLQRFGIEPYFESNDRDDAVGLNINPDGYYAIHYVFTYLTNYLGISDDLFLERAALALGVVSSVSQERLGSSLEEIITKNMTKLERRKQRNTLQSGSDPERDKTSEEQRPEYSSWDNTLALLIFADRPQD